MSMETFTLSEIMLANRLLFPADFERLWRKYNTSGMDDAHLFMLLYKKHNCNILSFLNEFSTDDDVVPNVSKMLRDILS